MKLLSTEVIVSAALSWSCAAACLCPSASSLLTARTVDVSRSPGGGASRPPPGRAEVFSGAVLLQRYERYVRHAHANARGPYLAGGPRQSSRTEAVPTCLPPPLHHGPWRPSLLALLCNSHGRPAAQQREAFIFGHKAHQIQLFWKG